METSSLDLWLMAVVFGLIFLGVGAYFFLMVFFPEWVGITGKVAQKNLEEHRGENKISGDTKGDSPTSEPND